MNNFIKEVGVSIAWAVIVTAVICAVVAMLAFLPAQRVEAQSCKVRCGSQKANAVHEINYKKIHYGYTWQVNNWPARSVRSSDFASKTKFKYNRKAGFNRGKAPKQR